MTKILLIQTSSSSSSSGEWNGRLLRLGGAKTGVAALKRADWTATSVGGQERRRLTKMGDRARQGDHRSLVQGTKWIKNLVVSAMWYYWCHRVEWLPSKWPRGHSTLGYNNPYGVGWHPPSHHYTRITESLISLPRGWCLCTGVTSHVLCFRLATYLDSRCTYIILATNDYSYMIHFLWNPIGNMKPWIALERAKIIIVTD